MGQLASRMFGVVTREVKMYNIEKRAEKVISKEKPDRAPMYPSTIKELERLKEDNVSTDYLTKKDENLDTYLKKVYVTSPDLPPPIKRLENPARLLPQNRFPNLDVSYGYSEAEEQNVPVGKVSLKQAMHFMSDHHKDPKIHTSEAIAAKYKLDINTTKDILEYFKIFNVHIKKKKNVDPETLNKYEKLQDEVQNMTMYNAGDIIKKLDTSKKFLNSKDEDEEDDDSDPRNVKR